MKLLPGQQNAMNVLQQRQDAGTIQPNGQARLSRLQGLRDLKPAQPTQMGINPAGQQMPPNSNSFQAGQAQGALRPQPLQRLDTIRQQQMGQGLAGLGQAHPAYGMSATLPPPQSPGLTQMAGQMQGQPPPLTPEQYQTQELNRGRMNPNGPNRPQVNLRANMITGGQGGSY